MHVVKLDVDNMLDQKPSWHPVGAAVVLLLLADEVAKTPNGSTRKRNEDNTKIGSDMHALNILKDWRKRFETCFVPVSQVSFLIILQRIFTF